MLTALGRMEAVLWRYLLYLRSESRPREDRAVVVDTFHGVTEGHLLSVVSRVKQPACFKIAHKDQSYVENVNQTYTKVCTNLDKKSKQ